MLKIAGLTLLTCSLCLTDDRCWWEESFSGPARVRTRTGDLLGVRQSELDPRTNRTVNWTSFFVSVPAPSLQSLTLLSCFTQDIPYARPPVSSLRFRPPQPPSSWSCLRDATRSEEKICPQIDFYELSLHDQSNEDCLYLNVYVPETKERGLAVMVWIHGGGYMFGTGTSKWYGPLLYLTHNVIVVSVRYRLGPLGFLSLGTEDVPGNAGVRDQVAALRWVQENIASFGGDPDLVTVYGQSAGSFAATYHIMSPLARLVLGGRGQFNSSYLYVVSGGCLREPSFRAEQEDSLPPSITSVRPGLSSTAGWRRPSWVVWLSVRQTSLTISGRNQWTAS